MISLPRLYPILDASCFSSPGAMFGCAEQLLGAGVTLLQYRNKNESALRMLDDARELKRLAGPDVQLIMNDRADLCLASGFSGVHLGQDDLSPEGARAVLGSGFWLGVSAHNPSQLQAADSPSADYLAIGPVFPTASKLNPDPVVGLDGVRRARSLTRKPLVAIGGITPENCASVMAAGADAVAVISSLWREPRKSVEEFFRAML